MAGTSSFSFLIDREAGIFDINVDYFIPAYSDPETFEEFYATRWNLTISAEDGSFGISGDGWDSGNASINIGFPPSDTIFRETLDFYAENTFSAESVSARLQLLNAGLAQTRVVLTAASSPGLIDDDTVLLGGSGDDELTGARGDDLLEAGDGDDTLIGGDGSDILSGGAGRDAMAGGAGNDTYYVDDAADTITEAEGGGRDLVYATTSYTLSAHVEDMILTGRGLLAGTGNGQDNLIFGNNEDNLLDGRSGDDQLLGYGGSDRLVGGMGDDVLDGGSGIDRMAGGMGNDSYIIDNLRDVIVESAEGGTDEAIVSGLASFVLAANVENLVNLGDAPVFTGRGNAGDNELVGGFGNDMLYGLGGADTLIGGDGTDLLEGGTGADSLDGGEGVDTASYARAASAVTVHLGGLPGAGDAAGDTFSGIENLVGSRFGDSLTGDTGNNRLIGGAGDDSLVGGGGIDWLVGGSGADQLVGDGNDGVSYTGSDGPVTVNLVSQTASGGHAAGDTLVGIARAEGSALADTITGNDTDNQLIGGGGNDVIDGAGGNDFIRGGSGDDRLSGGDGIDTLDYSDATSRVFVNFLAGVTRGGFSGRDTFSGFEKVRGSAHNDVLTADNFGRELFGGDGADTITGGTGRDTVIGGAGADTMDGGSGIDTLSYATSRNYVSVDLENNLSFGDDAKGDVFFGFENLRGGMVSDSLYGDGGRNVIWGGDGGDYIDGRGGDDLLIGGSGDEAFAFGLNSGFDTIRDFTAGGNEDRLILSEMGPFFATFDQVLAAAVQDGANTVITFGTGLGIVLEGVDRASLTIEDLVF